MVPPHGFEPRTYWLQINCSTSWATRAQTFFIRILLLINIFKVANINSTLKFLREKNFWVYGFSSDGSEDFTNYDWKGNNVLLFGSEGFGLNEKTEKYVDYFVKIKINKDLESLNISNSASIVFFHINKAKKIVD